MMRRERGKLMNLPPFFPSCPPVEQPHLQYFYPHTAVVSWLLIGHMKHKVMCSRVAVFAPVKYSSVDAATFRFYL